MMDNAHKEKHTLDQRKWRKDKEHAALLQEDARIMREIAARLGYFISRGVGAGNAGNISAAISLLCRAYRRDPDGLMAYLETLQATDDAPADPPA